MTKQEFIDFARRFGWTKKDAERALAAAEIRIPKTHDEVIRILMEFAGSELAERQRLQAAQKGLVTKKTKLIVQREQEHQQRLQALEEAAEQERSQLVPIIEKIYTFAQKFGLKDPWIEALLETYDRYRAS